MSDASTGGQILLRVCKLTTWSRSGFQSKSVCHPEPSLCSWRRGARPSLVAVAGFQPAMPHGEAAHRRVNPSRAKKPPAGCRTQRAGSPRSPSPSAITHASTAWIRLSLRRISIRWFSPPRVLDETERGFMDAAPRNTQTIGGSSQAQNDGLFGLAAARGGPVSEFNNTP